MGLAIVINAIDHVAIVVRDGDAAGVHYQEVLGLDLVHDEDLYDVGVRLLYFDAHTSMVQLVQPLSAGPIADFLETNGEGLHHVCFRVDRIDSLLSKMVGQSDVEVFQGGRGRRACFLKEQPNGVRIELTETDPVFDFSARICHG